MDQVQIFVNVDSQGNIVEIFTGEKLVATESFDFYFFKNKQVAEDIDSYKVKLTGLKADLVLKEEGE